MTLAYLQLCQDSPRKEINIRADCIVSWTRDTYTGGSVVEYEVGAERQQVAVLENPDELARRLHRALSGPEETS